MTKSFQKSANTIQELRLDHPGIINPRDFNRQFELHCYKPSPDLQPFVVHIWTQRIKKPVYPHAKIPLEITPGPNTYLFFTPQSTFVHDVTKHVFTYDALRSDVIAGVKFQPGGFYPFLQRQQPSSQPFASVASTFPTIDTSFTTNLLTQTDATIVEMIENLLRASHPQNTKNIHLVGRIVTALSTDNSLRTVSAAARAFGMSERSLQLLFQTYVGIGVKRIIARRRLLEAISRMQRGSPVKWGGIAADLGYSSQSHFSREFKRITGVSPSQYSKELGGKQYHPHS